MFVLQQLLILLLVSLCKSNVRHDIPLKSMTTKLPTNIVHLTTKSPIKNSIDTKTSTTTSQNENNLTTTTTSEIKIVTETPTDEIKNEVSVNELLEIAERPYITPTKDSHQGPHYEANWGFIDKDTIRVTFELFFIPSSLIESNLHLQPQKHKFNLLATMSTKPPRSLQSITLLEYFLFVIRPYHKHREIILNMEKLHLRNTTSKPYHHFSNALRLTSLNHNEKYSVCIYYYRTNHSIRFPDLLLCQDIINDYTKFANLRTDPKHGLFFIMTQYSIIIGLLFVLQSVLTMRKRRVAQFISQHLASKAHSIRTTFSSVSLVRQSFSSLDTAAEQQQQQQQQQQNASNSQAVQHEPTINEEEETKSATQSSPKIIISEPTKSINDNQANFEENEPFLKHIPSRNHVHFLLGPGGGSDDEEDEEEDIELHSPLNSQTESTHIEPYNDQSDALKCMAHILNTNKPWSRLNHRTSPV